jgi:hypothetical protein
MKRLRFNGPTGELVVGDQTIQRGEEFEADEAQAEFLLSWDDVEVSLAESTEADSTRAGQKQKAGN